MFDYSVVDDSDFVSYEQVEGIVRSLCVSYAHVRRSFLQNQNTITAALKAGEVKEAVLLLSAGYRLPRSILKGIGYSKKMSAIASLNMEVETFSGRLLRSTMYFQQSKVDLCEMPQYRLLHIIAHELAHARMHIDRHKLQRSEFATDVLALLVTGNSKGYDEAMIEPFARYGYIRSELLDEVYRCLAKHADVIYMK